jgi:hypothetical protein
MAVSRAAWWGLSSHGLLQRGQLRLAVAEVVRPGIALQQEGIELLTHGPKAHDPYDIFYVT